MSKTVKPQNYQTCICGQVCKGQLALMNHAKKCIMEQERSRIFIEFSHRGKTLSDATFLSAWHKAHSQSVPA